MPQEVIEGLHDASGKTGFPVLKDGDYEVEIVKSEKVRNKKDNGDLYRFQMSVIEGPDQDDDKNPSPVGRVVFHQANIMDPDHPSAEYRYIGLNELKALINATGAKVTSSNKFNHEDLVGEQLIVRLGTEKGLDGEPRNTVKKVKAME